MTQEEIDIVQHLLDLLRVATMGSEAGSNICGHYQVWLDKIKEKNQR